MSKSRIYDGEPPGGIAIYTKSETDEVTALEDVNESIETANKILKPSYFLYTSEEAAKWREKCLESLKDDLMKAIYEEMDKESNNMEISHT